MGRPKGKKSDRDKKTESVARPILIGLRGTPEYSAWLERVHRKTSIPKAVILRLALKVWAETNGHELPPEM